MENGIVPNELAESRCQMIRIPRGFIPGAFDKGYRPRQSRIRVVAPQVAGRYDYPSAEVMIMKKRMMVLLTVGVLGIGMAGLGWLHIRSLAAKNEAMARFVNEIAAQCPVTPPSLADKSTRTAIPRLMAALAKEDDILEQGYSWLHAVLPDRISARLPEIYPSAMIRLNAAAAVGQWGPCARAAVPQLRRLLQDDLVDCNAALSLGEIGAGAKVAVPDLIIAVEQQRPGAATALGMLGPAGRTAREDLFTAALSAPEWQRHEVIEALHRIGQPLTAQK